MGNTLELKNRNSSPPNEFLIGTWIISLMKKYDKSIINKFLRNDLSDDDYISLLSKIDIPFIKLKISKTGNINFISKFDNKVTIYDGPALNWTQYKLNLSETLSLNLLDNSNKDSITLSGFDMIKIKY